MKFIIILLSIFMLKLSAYSDRDPQTKLIEEKLKKSIENVKNFKTKKNNEIKMLNAEIDRLQLTINKLKRQYKQCQRSKRNTTNNLTEQLNISENNFYILYDENRKLKEALSKYQKRVPTETPSQPIETPSIQEETPIINDTLESSIIEPISMKVEWVEVVVENDMSIYELALQYYGKESEYTQIYRSNKDVIPETLKLANGMSLKLPVTHNFRERPFILNQN